MAGALLRVLRAKNWLDAFKTANAEKSPCCFVFLRKLARGACAPTLRDVCDFRGRALANEGCYGYADVCSLAAPLLACVVAGSVSRVVDFANARIDSQTDLLYREKTLENALTDTSDTVYFSAVR